MVSQKDVTGSGPTFNFVRYSFPDEGVCHLQLERHPVNALNTTFWTELLRLLDYLEDELYPKTVRVLVISSNARGAIFSAGNDLTELYVRSTTKPKFTKFWITSTTFLSRLYKSPLYTIAAIRGATPAGGCIMALCCDYRLALHDTTMGLNEVKIGLAVPKYWARLLIRTINTRSSGEEMLASGNMISAHEAKSLGLVDKVLAKGGPAELTEEALTIAQRWTDVKEVGGRAEAKLYIRQEFADMWSNYGMEESRRAWSQLSDPATVSTLGAVMKGLSRKASAKM